MPARQPSGRSPWSAPRLEYTREPVKMSPFTAPSAEIITSTDITPPAVGPRGRLRQHLGCDRIGRGAGVLNPRPNDERGVDERVNDGDCQRFRAAARGEMLRRDRALRRRRTLRRSSLRRCRGPESSPDRTNPSPPALVGACGKNSSPNEKPATITAKSPRTLTTLSTFCAVLPSATPATLKAVITITLDAAAMLGGVVPQEARAA